MGGIRIPEAVCLVVAATYLLKKLAEPSLDRVAQRLSEWLLPDDRPITYRVARGLATVCLHLAPRGTSARFGCEAAIGDIDEMQRLNAYALDPVRIAFSLVRPAASNRLAICAKRVMDITLASITLLTFAPVLCMIAIAIKLDSRGPVFFSQLRAGQNGRPFRIHKFRTMVRDAEHWLQEIVPFDSLSEPMFKLRDDPRVTRVGRFLRDWRFDEFPQLFDVLLGHMSLVGPRPEQLDLVELYKPEHLFRLDVKPGLTGPVEVGVHRFEQRLAIERQYVEEHSVRRDVRILLRSIQRLITGTNI